MVDFVEVVGMLWGVVYGYYCNKMEVCLVMCDCVFVCMLEGFDVGDGLLLFVMLCCVVLYYL